MLVEVDGLPVVLLHGDRPAWRDLGSGVDDGEDIRQLEQALTDLGYAGSGLTVDDEWTSATTTAVKKLQKALGMDDDGRLQLGEVVFAPSTVRIDSVGGHLGDAANAAAVKVTGELQLVDATAKPSYSDIVAPATTVDIELPSGRHVAGVIYSVGAPTTDSQGTTTLPVTVVVADGESLDAVDGLAVDVDVSVVAVPGATAVPAAALLALAEGGYAVEVPDASTASGTRLVGVELGAFDEDGWVQITGDVKPGDQVRRAVSRGARAGGGRQGVPGHPAGAGARRRRSRRAAVASWSS